MNFNFVINLQPGHVSSRSGSPKLFPRTVSETTVVDITYSDQIRCCSAVFINAITKNVLFLWLIISHISQHTWLTLRTVSDKPVHELWAASGICICLCDISGVCLVYFSSTAPFKPTNPAQINWRTYVGASSWGRGVLSVLGCRQTVWRCFSSSAGVELPTLSALHLKTLKHLQESVLRFESRQQRCMSL